MITCTALGQLGEDGRCLAGFRQVGKSNRWQPWETTSLPTAQIPTAQKFAIMQSMQASRLRRSQRTQGAAAAVSGPAAGHSPACE